MHLCTCVGEEGGDGEGAGEGGDTKAGALSLEVLSLDTHRREVAGAHGCYTQKHKCQFRHSTSEPVALFALQRQAPGQL